MRPALLLACVALVMGSVGSAAAYPSGFSEEVVAAGLTDPTAIAFFPDGRIAIAQKSGIVRLVPVSGLGDDDYLYGVVGEAIGPFGASSSVKAHYVGSASKAFLDLPEQLVD